jgi:hypothetical protein
MGIAYFHRGSRIEVSHAAALRRGNVLVETQSIRRTTDCFEDIAKDTLCRNVTIYGKCRYEDKGWLLASML